MRRWRWWRIGKRLRQIKLLVLDVDGVLTDGGLWFDASGQLTKRFDVRDGLGIRLLQQAGVEIAFLSGGQGGATEVRARQLGIQHCLVGIKDKPEALLQLQQQREIDSSETAFVGDKHTHTHARDTCAVTPHRPRAPSFSKETISNAEFIATTLHSSTLSIRLRSSIKTKKSLRAASQPAVHQQIEVSIVFVSSLVSFPVPVEYSVVLALRSFLSDVHGFARTAHHELIVEQ